MDRPPSAHGAARPARHRRQQGRVPDAERAVGGPAKWHAVPRYPLVQT